jgi:6-phospho-3-hexuloisomerase
MAETLTEAYGLILQELQSSLSSVEQAETEKLLDTILQKKRIFVTGAGRMGIMLQAFSMRLNHLGLSSHNVGSVNCPPISSDDLLLVASSSGETSTVREVVLRAKEVNATVALITSTADSTIARLASITVFLKGPSTLEQSDEAATLSRQPMKSLFEQSLFLLLESLVLRMMNLTNQTSSDMAKRHANLE